jgi:hypothetical protein
MDSIRSFKKHHTNTFNLSFHVLCGIVYTSMCVHLIGVWSLIPYFLSLCYVFPEYMYVNICITTVLYVLNELYNKMKLSVPLKLGIVICFYMAPELSHWITGETTVLQLNNVSISSVIENFVFLLPLSILSFFIES